VAVISDLRILEKLGHTAHFDESIVCCGQPAFNTGCRNEARDVAVRVVDRLKNAEVVVIPSGSCGAMIRGFHLIAASVLTPSRLRRSR